MSRKIAAVVAAFAVAAPLAVPALASANATTSFVARQFSRTIHNRAALSGIRVLSTSVRCKSDGGGYYSCFATYVARTRGVTAKFGEYINVTPTRWSTVGSPRRIW